MAKPRQATTSGRDIKPANVMSGRSCSAEYNSAVKYNNHSNKNTILRDKQRYRRIKRESLIKLLFDEDDEERR